MKRFILATILGGIVMFVWSAVVHMNPVTAPMGLSMLNEKEDVVMAALKQNVPGPGLYFFPGMDMTKHMSKEEEDAWTAKYKAGPSGLLLIQPAGMDPMMTGQLIIQLVSTIACALVAAIILASTVGSYLRRTFIVVLLGLFSWIAISIPTWNWYEYPFPFIALDAINLLIGWLLAGLVMAKLIKPAAPVAPAPVPTAA